MTKRFPLWLLAMEFINGYDTIAATTINTNSGPASSSSNSSDTVT